MEALTSGSAAGNVTQASVTYFGGADDQRGTGLALAGSELYVAGTNMTQASGLTVKYGVPPAAPVWNSTLGNSTHFSGAAAAPGGGVYAVGGCFPPACGASDGAGGTEYKGGIVEYSSGGSLVFAKSPNFFAYRGSEEFRAATTTTESGSTFVYAVGFGEPCSYALFILGKFDASGNLVAKATEPGMEPDFATSCAVISPNTSADGSAIIAVGNALYIAGSSASRPGDSDSALRPVLLKYDRGLNRLWKQRPNDVTGQLLGITEMSGSLYAVGYASSSGQDYLIQKYDLNGNRLWTRSSGGAGTDVLTAVVGVGSRLFVAGYTTSSGAGGLDGVVLEIDAANGNTLSTTLFGGVQDDIFNAVATDGTDLYAVGESRSTAQGGNAVGQSDIVLVRYTLTAATTLSATGTGAYGGTATLQATLSSSSGPVSGATINFTLFGNSVGSAVTDANGVASLTNVSLTGGNAGSYAGVVGASFAGVANYLSSSAPGDLSVNQAAATIAVSGAGTFLYDGQAHAAAGSVTGVLGESLGAASIAYTNLSTNATSFSAPVNAGSYRVNASYGGNTNYLPGANNSLTITINQLSTATSLTVLTAPWQTKSSMPTARNGAAAAALNGLIYVAGGWNGFHRLTVEAYNPSTDTWTGKADRPYPSQTNPATGVINGKLYTAGGTDCCIEINPTYEYTPATDSWASKASMPTTRQLATGGVVNNRLYVAGGLNTVGSGPQGTFSTLEEFDPAAGAAGTWTSKASMPTARRGAGGAAAGGQFYVMGGQNASGIALNTVEAYDPSTNTWTTKAPMPTARASFEIAEVGGLFYAIGGADGTGANRLTTVEAYDPSTNTWSTYAPMLTARNHHKAVAVNGTIYAIGGNSNQADTVGTNEAYTPPSPPASSTFGETVTLTATVNIVASGGGTPGGTVTFRNGASVVGTATLNGSGVATLATSTLAVGSYAITAEYGGSANVAGSTSGPSDLTVTGSSTTTTLSSSANPSVFGQPVMFTANVAGLGGTPSGTVTFKDGAATLGTGILSGGTATFAMSSLSVASHAITAAYGGDINFPESTSSTLPQTVNKATPTVHISLGTYRFDGRAHPATATATGVNGALVNGGFDFTYSPGGSSPPINAGSYAVTADFTSADSNYTNATESNGPLTITANNAPQFIAPTPFAPVSVQAGSQVSVTVRASDPDAGDLVSVNLDVTTLPSGSGSGTNGPANPADRTFTWTPQSGDVGAHTIQFAAIDNLDASTPLSVTINVTPPPDTTPPTLSPMPNITIQGTSSTGGFVNVPLPTATDSGSGVQSVSCDRSSGSFPFGTTTVTCTARDNAGNTSSVSFTVFVGPQTGYYLLTVHMVGLGNPPVTGVVGIVPLALLCSQPDGSGQCTFQVQAGTALRLNGNAPTPSTPVVFSGGTGPAGACATSTCRFVMTGNAGITATLDPAAPVYTMSINLAGDGPGEVFVDNSRCQNYDHDMAHLPTQFSACQTSYAPNSEVTLEPWPPAGSRFVRFSNGTNNASVCGIGTSCSFVLNDNTSVSATFSALTSIAVSPLNDTISISQSRQFTATGTYSDLVTQPLFTGGMGSWKTRTSMGQIRFNFAAAAAGGRVYALGGINGREPGSSILGSVEAYDPSSNSWTTKQGMSPRSGLGAGTIDNRYIYAVGGNMPGACPIDSLDVYDTVTDTWTAKAPMPGGPRRNLSAAVVGRTLYAIGGELNQCGQTSGTALKRVEAYDPDTDQWTTLADMPTARSFFGVGVVNGIIYAVGGGDTQGNLSTVEAYDPATNTWSAKAPLPSARSLHAVAVIHNILYVVGGNNGEYFSSVFGYDPATNAWSNKASIPQVEDTVGSISGQRAELAAVTLDGKLYAMGGLVRPGGSPLAPPVAIVTAFVDSLVWSSSDNGVATIVNQNQSGNPFGRATGLQAGTTTIRARASSVACDTPPGQCATLTVSDTVANTLPTVTIFGSPMGNPAVTINTGQNVSTTGSNSGNFRDPDQGQTWTATVNYGDGSGQQQLNLGLGNSPNEPTGTFSLNHVYNQGGVYTVTVKVMDSLGGFGTATLTVTVNQAPSQIFLGLPNAAFTQVTNNAQWGCGSFFSSQNSAGPWSATVNYGDGSGNQLLPLTIPAPPPGPESPCVGSGGTPPTGVFSFNHAYTSAGNFQVSVTVTNTGTGASRTGGFTIEVSEGGGGDRCALVSTNLVAGTVPFSTVQMSIFERATGELVFTENVPLGMTELGEAPAGLYRVEFSVPAGYTITPAQIDFDAICGGEVVLNAQIGVADTTPPTLTLNGANPLTVEGGSPIVDPGATATDAVDGDLTAAISVTGTVNANVLGSYTLTYTVSDQAGNTASISRTVNVVDTTPPTLTLPANMTVDATSPAGAVVTHTVSASDLVSGTVAVTCVPSSGSTFPIGTSTVNCTAVDRAGNSVGGSFQVLVQAAAAQVSHLIVTVQTFNLAQGIENSLDTKLQNVLSALDAAKNGNVGSVCGQMGALINETMAQSGKSLTVTQANQLLDSARQIRAVIGCQ